MAQSTLALCIQPQKILNSLGILTHWIYTKVNEKGNMFIVFLYVDDLIFTSDFGIKDLRTIMESKFEMTDLGLMKFFMGIEVHQSESGIFISQPKNASEVLKIFNTCN